MMHRVRRASIVALLASAGALASGCTYQAPFVPPLGNAFSATSAPIDVTFDATDATGKVGRSSSKSFCGLFAWGDATVDSAAKNANLTVVEQVDCRFTCIFFGFYTEFETIVTGR